jgi:hypothetical protein
MSTFERVSTRRSAALANQSPSVQSTASRQQSTPQPAAPPSHTPTVCDACVVIIGSDGLLYELLCIFFSRNPPSRHTCSPSRACCTRVASVGRASYCCCATTRPVDNGVRHVHAASCTRTGRRPATSHREQRASRTTSAHSARCATAIAHAGYSSATTYTCRV